MSRTAADHAVDIAQALATEGGHLFIGHYGATLHHGQYRTSGFDPDVMKAACAAAGLPVIDTRAADFIAAARVTIGGPMVAVDCSPDPEPWHALTCAPLEHVAEAYRAAGAEVLNLPSAVTEPAPERERRDEVS